MRAQRVRVRCFVRLSMRTGHRNFRDFQHLPEGWADISPTITSENFYTNGFHDLCKCGILLWYRALCEGGSRNRDGVIVGSAIVKLCEKYGADCVPHISTFVKEMKDAIR